MPGGIIAPIPMLCGPMPGGPIIGGAGSGGGGGMGGGIPIGIPGGGIPGGGIGGGKGETIMDYSGLGSITTSDDEEYHSDRGRSSSLTRIPDCE